jgi:hypothetical protein
MVVCPHERGGNNPDKMTMLSLGARRNASSATASAGARAINKPGRHGAHAYAVLVRAVSAYNPRPRMQRASDAKAPPPSPSTPLPPRCASAAAFYPTLFLRSTFGIANNDNTKDNRAKEEGEGVPVGDGD